MVKKHIYKVYRNGSFLGRLDDVKSLFEFAQEINSAGAMITIDIAKSVDTASMAPDWLACEDDTILSTEDGLYIALERVSDLIGDSSDQILMREGNVIKVIEYNDYSPNGKQMFSGRIQHVEAEFGENADDIVTLYVYSDGYDLNGHVIPGSNSLFLDQSQTSQDGSYTFVGSIGPTTYDFGFGQTWTTGSSISNLAAIELMLAYTGSGSTQSCTVSVYSSPYDYNNGVAPLATATQVISAASPTVCRFALSSTLTLLPNHQYYFLVTSTTRTDISIYYLNSSSYAGGNMWGQFIGLANVSSFAPNCLYFKTYYSTLTTKTIFPSQELQTTLLSIVNSYSLEGGTISANSSTCDSTGVVVPYTFSLATTLEGIQTVKSLAPSNYYWYVDLQTDLLYFKQTSTTADFILIRGRHINSIKLVSSIENVKNKIFFTGGDTGGGVNYYSSYQDYTSINNYGISVDRISDNRITAAAQANAVGQSYLTANKDKQYQTKVTILATTMDITLLKPGKNVTFRGFGTFVDQLVIQIVRVEYASDKVTLTLGALPPRLNTILVQAVADITALQTVDNPAVPS